MPSIHYITSDILNLSDIQAIIHDRMTLKLSEDTIKKIEACRTYLDDKMDSVEKPIYGINTGFGALHNVKISKENLTVLQENLVKSHACGTGEEVPQSIVKLMMLFKIQSLSYGHSAAQLATVNRLIDFYNHDIVPIIYTQGSLGASGDLAPLAHLALPLIGEGEVWHHGERYTGQQILEKFDWNKIELQSKEGLALLNGTQFMSAYGVWILLKAYKLSYLADLIGALSLDVFDGRIEPFNELIHLIRPHNGQVKIAKRIKEFLQGSQLINQSKKHLQDPYSFRCMPQVHGASFDTFEFARKTFETEINAVTDNPNIFVGEDEIISGWNFHGQPLALELDYLIIALSELCNISERRIFQFVSGFRGLPTFLVSNPGLNSGFMIPQYTAASIVSENKQLSTPASVDSIVSSNGQEDHVSMGANSATKAKRIVDNVETILAIELLNAVQALEFRKPLKSSEFLDSFATLFRSDIPFVEEDRVLRYDIEKSVAFIQNLTIDTKELFS
ncbi:MAG: histidine ammonia-lyase [Flavobacteriaceae bacterium]|nr:histidine ammonia-lyase [Flavobacteriaceae bacterium]